MKRIMLVDDEPKLIKIFKSMLSKKGYIVHTATNGQEARKKIVELDVNIIFLDLRLPDCTGLELLEEFSSYYPEKIYIMMTAYGNIENAVSAMKAGAFDYIVKPAKINEILIIIEKAFKWINVNKENRELKAKLQVNEMNEEIIGSTPAMKRIFEMIERVSSTNTNVLLQGESGTGKTMVAEIIHNYSKQNGLTFIPVNCAALPEQLLESELFGHIKGAFSGAVSNRMGKFEAANGGTIFLDEISETSLAFQAKLLQVTQSKTFIPVGSDKLKQVNVRIIAATNKDLQKMVNEGDFREDLYYRLNVVDIHIPPLRERKDDILILINMFLKKHGEKNKINYQLSDSILNLLVYYSWPGNVRELESAIERAVVLSRDGHLSLDGFPQQIQDFANQYSHMDTLNKEQSLPERLEAIEKRIILEALDQSSGKLASAAKTLGISRQSLFYKTKKYFNQ